MFRSVRRRLVTVGYSKRTASGAIGVCGQRATQLLTCMFSRLFRRSTVSTLCYGILVLITTFFVAISCAFLLSQAARTAPNRGFIKNINAVVIGAAYVLVVRSRSDVVGMSFDM